MASVMMERLGSPDAATRIYSYTINDSPNPFQTIQQPFGLLKESIRAHLRSNGTVSLSRTEYRPLMPWTSARASIKPALMALKKIRWLDAPHRQHRKIAQACKLPHQGEKKRIFAYQVTPQPGEVTSSYAWAVGYLSGQQQDPT